MPILTPFPLEQGETAWRSFHQVQADSCIDQHCNACNTTDFAMFKPINFLIAIALSCEFLNSQLNKQKIQLQAKFKTENL